MQPQTTKEIVVYHQHHQQYAQQYSKRLTIPQFKKIDAARINNQFIILQNSYTPNEQQVFHWAQKNKDRYSDILSYKHNRVTCQKVNNFYINASMMKSVLDNEVYAVFAQAPVKKVVDHFWYACYHYDIKKIIMLCAFEDPNRGTQAEKYWPPVGEEVNLHAVKISIRCLSQEKVDEDYVKTRVAIKGEEGQKIVQHIHWFGWTDMKKPLGQKGQTLFANLVEECLSHISKKELFLLHCSAGVGRTGTLGTMIQALRCARQKNQLSVFQIVDNMRRHRMACVQTSEQYKFIYQTLNKML